MASTQIVAQPASCSTPANRYHDGVFPGNPIKTADVVYGSNIMFNDTVQTLLMDVYEPACDVATNRPVIIFVHGGGFTSGNKTQMSLYCTQFAKLGYVTATIEYRQGVGDYPSAMMRATHDARAAVRWFRKNATVGIR